MGIKFILKDKHTGHSIIVEVLSNSRANIKFMLG